MPEAEVLVVEVGRSVSTSDQGAYVVAELKPGRYTLVISKPGYVRFVKADVVVTSGALTEVDADLSGEFVEMEEFVVEDLLAMGGGGEAALLELRLDSAALMDSISSDLMQRAGASDASSALPLVAGASVQDGKFAVIRGLPDRYVSSQMNGVRLPSADQDKRAVELDQFPSSVIDSLQVTKTFLPSQQGDASGGAVDVRLRGVPTETTIQFKSQVGNSTQLTGTSDFLTYDGGGVDSLGRGHGRPGVQTENLGDDWTGAVGVSTDDAPVNHKWSMAGGGSDFVNDEVKIGGFLSLFYERQNTHFDDGVNNSYWVTTPGQGLVPLTLQGTPLEGDFKTALFDVRQSTAGVRWGGLATFGVETENHQVGLTYLYTRNVTDRTTLAEDTRGKEYFFPGYDPTDPMGPGNISSEVNAAPYIRTETLEYTERSAGTLQLNGKHQLPGDGFELGDALRFEAPELDWTISSSFADSNQPDKRQFGSLWLPASFNPGAPPFIPPFTTEPVFLPFKPAANFNLGNLQRIFTTIEEDSKQLALNLKWPFEQWDGERGFAQIGYFGDRVDRTFNQDTFSNFGDASATFEGEWEEFWSATFPNEPHPVTASEFDIDYRGNQDIAAWYGMMELPLSERLDVVFGARFESTDIGIVNEPEGDATWFPPGATAPVTLNPGDSDVTFGQDDVLPAIGVDFAVNDAFTVRAAFSQTVARQTFKELTPIIQQEFLGGPIFIGNPELQMSDLTNYDLRADYVPSPGALMSVSVFQKNIKNPIETVQRLAGFNFTTPVNYPEGRLRGIEAEVRQSLGEVWAPLDGFGVGVNATWIDGRVQLPDFEIEALSQPNIAAPITERDMTNAPDHLYNLFLTYDVPSTGTQLGLFYTVQGDTLIAGPGESLGNFVPSIYAREFDTLNFSLSQQLGRFLRLQFQAKNLTNPSIEQVYRSQYIEEELTRGSFTRGIEYTLSISASFGF